MGVSLEEGFELLIASKATVAEFNKKRIANVQAEKLFNLEISKYPKLVDMEEGNKKFDEIYGVFDEFSKEVQQFGTVNWQRLKIDDLEQTADKFVRAVASMARKNPAFETSPPYINLKERVQGFKDSLPLIGMLNDDAVKERHWQRILEETGKEGQMEINVKTMSLTKVFELELAKYEEVVTEICKEAMEEAKIETMLREIEETWKK